MTGSIQTEVQLEFIYDESRSRTLLSKRQAGGLCSISKPYWNENVLGLQLVNPTAGLFAGDSLGMNVMIGVGAQVALTSPSATRYHTMPDGRAEIRQDFTVSDHAWLDYWPEIIIPQKDSDVVQTTTIRLAKRATMVFFDSLAPGRVAHGENYQFRRLETCLQIYQDDELVVKERCVLSPTTGKWPLEVQGWENCYYGAIWIAGEHARQAIADLQADEGLNDEVSHVGASLLSRDLGVIRIISPSSLLLKKSTLHFRHILQARLPLLKMSFRKL